MKEIKSKKAKSFILNIVEPIPTPNGELVFYVEMTALQVVESIIIAEQEAEEQHRIELQAVHDMYKKIFIEHESQINSDNYHNEENHKIELQELRDKITNLSICDIDAPTFTHTKEFRSHFDYIKKCFIELLK